MSEKVVRTALAVSLKALDKIGEGDWTPQDSAHLHLVRMVEKYLLAAGVAPVTPARRPEHSTVAPSRLIVRRGLRLCRWRLVAWFRCYRGNGSANFEFEFRLGFPRHSPSVQRAHEAMLSVVPDEYSGAVDG